jgi:hypothetical protein
LNISDATGAALEVVLGLLGFAGGGLGIAGIGAAANVADAPVIAAIITSAANRLFIGSPRKFSAPPNHADNLYSLSAGDQLCGCYRPEIRAQ